MLEDDTQLQMLRQIEDEESLKQFINRNYKRNRERTFKIIKLYTLRYTYDDIADETGCTSRNVAKIMHEFKVKVKFALKGENDGKGSSKKRTREDNRMD